MILLSRVKGATSRNFWNAEIYREDGAWRRIGTLPGEHCEGDLDALLAGLFKAVPAPPPSPAIQIGSHSLSIAPLRPIVPKC